MIVGMYKLEKLYKNKELFKEHTLVDVFVQSILTHEMKRKVFDYLESHQENPTYSDQKEMIYEMCMKLNIDHTHMFVVNPKLLSDKTHKPKYKRCGSAKKRGIKFHEYRCT